MVAAVLRGYLVDISCSLEDFVVESCEENTAP